MANWIKFSLVCLKQRLWPLIGENDGNSDNDKCKVIFLCVVGVLFHNWLIANLIRLDISDQYQDNTKVLYLCCA